MANTWFQFKQFTIHQDKCAMKVCTDACLFGAAVVSETNGIALFDVLDIGCGTGLLSLMLAQKTTAAIAAVEIDEQAYQQAAENIELSPFKNILPFNTDICNFYPDVRYDLIISNPPFFEGDLKSTHKNKNAAKHDTHLTLVQLVDIAEKNLQTCGIFAVLLPYHRQEYCIAEAAKKNLFPSKIIAVKQTPAHIFFRSMLFFTRNIIETQKEIITIKNEAGNYTGQFTTLLKDYYLHL